MSRRLKKKDSPSSLALSEDAIKFLTEIVKGNEFCKTMRNLLLDIINCKTNGKDQLEQLKKVKTYLKQDGIAFTSPILLALAHMFLSSAPCHPMRRCLVSILESIASEEELKCSIVSILSNGIMNMIKQSVEESQQRMTLDAILALMENFTIGEKVIHENHVQVFSFLKDLLMNSMLCVRSASTPQERTKWMQNILSVLKSIIAVLQRCQSVIRDLTEHDTSINDNFDVYLSHAVQIINDEFYILDCRVTAAMIFPALMLFLSEKSMYHILCVFQTLINRDVNHELHFSGKLEVMLRKYIQLCFEAVRNNSPASLLVLLNAMLVKIPTTFLHDHFIDSSNTSFFQSLFIKPLIKISMNTFDKSILLLSFKAISFWVNETIIVSENINTIYEDSLKETISHSVLPLLVSFVDHHIDSVRHNVKNAIKQCLLILSGDDDSYVKYLTIEYFQGDMKSRGKITMLVILTELTSVEEILNNQPKLPEDILSVMDDVDLASHACSLYEVIAIKHYQELVKNNGDMKTWLQFWVEQISHPLSNGSKELKANIVNFIIPSLLKIYPNVIFEFMDLSSTMTLVQVRTFNAFLKSLRAMKNICKDSDVTFEKVLQCNVEREGYWKNLISCEDLKKCLVHVDNQVCLDALSLICNSVKSTDAVDCNDFLLVRYCMQYNMANENPSFRQQILSHLKKLIYRVFTHASQLEKQQSNNGSPMIDYINSYSIFLSWLVRYSFSKLHKSAPYCQTSFSLDLILLITKIFREYKSSYLVLEINFTEIEKNNFTDILIGCFQDTYDPNRQLVHEIFSENPCFNMPLTKEKIVLIFRDILNRLASPQPDISLVAAYLICFLVRTCNFVDLNQVIEACSEEINEGYFQPHDGEESNVLLVLNFLYYLLKKQLYMMKQSLISASQKASLYGVLYCIRILLQFQGKDIQILLVTFPQAISLFLKDIIHIGLDIIQLVSQYVSNDAPEGYLCDASLAEVFQQLNLTELDNSNIEFQAQVARMLLVCCWRSMKEVSLLLGVIVSEFSNKENNYLSSGTLIKIWDIFSNILLRSKHAGAYELASLGFIKLCSVFWLSDDVDLQDVPMKAVKSLVLELMSDEQYENAQVTRRSAGLPFYLQALCNTEPPIRNKNSFKCLMSNLTCLCKTKGFSHDINKVVIALNILRAFYKDSKLSEDVFPFISDGVIIAITGFASSIWAIRNSCTLLYSALLQRIFGVKKSRMTGREFFSRFPALYSFLIEQSKVMVSAVELKENSASSLHPSIFPVLLILSHIYPSTIEGSDSVMKLSAFVPYIVSCGSSSVYKTRTMSAKALVPLVSSERSHQIILQLLTQIQTSKTLKKAINQNSLHGGCLQIKALLESYLLYNADNNNIKIIVDAVNNASWVVFCDKIPHMTKAVFLDIMVILLQNGFSIHTTTVIDTCLMSLLSTCGTTYHLHETFGFSIFLRSAITYIGLLLKNYHDTVLVSFNNIQVNHISTSSQLVLTLLESRNTEVRSKALELLVHHNAETELDEQTSDKLWIMMSSGNLKSTSYMQLLSVLSDVLFGSNFTNVDSLLELWIKLYVYKDWISLSDDARVAVLKFASLVIDKLEKEITQISTYKNALNEIWRFIEDCASADQCYDSRYLVAVLLKQTSYFTFRSEIEDLTYVYIRCCITLLKDSDVDIRNQTAKSLYPVFLPTGDSFDTPQPSVIFEKLFNEKISNMLSLQPIICLKYIINIILQMDHKLQDNDHTVDITTNALGQNSNEVLKQFVVFEEGKANPYFDEVEVCEYFYDIVIKYCISHDPPRMIDEWLVNVHKSLDAKSVLSAKEKYAKRVFDLWLNLEL